MKLRLSAAPRTAYLARGPASRACRQLPQPVLVENLRPELLRLGQFRARGVARDHVVGLLRDRARDLAAGALDETLGLASCEVGQGAREHEGLAVERYALGTALGLVELEAQASLAQALHQPLRGLLGELLLDLRRGYRPDALDLLDLLRIGGHQRVHRAEVLRQRLRSDVADPGKPDGEEDHRKGHLLRLLDRRDEIVGGDLAEAVERHELLSGEVVDVGLIGDQALVEEAVGELLAEALDVHHPHEVLQELEGLPRAATPVRADREDGVLGLDRRRAAGRALRGWLGLAKPLALSLLDQG